MARQKMILLHCYCCGEYKPPSEFARDRSRWHGCQDACRDCRRGMQRDYQRGYYLEHKDTLLPKHRESARRSWDKKMRLQKRRRHVPAHKN